MMFRKSRVGPTPISFLPFLKRVFCRDGYRNYSSVSVDLRKRRSGEIDEDCLLAPQHLGLLT